MSASKGVGTSDGGLTSGQEEDEEGPTQTAKRAGPKLASAFVRTVGQKKASATFGVSNGAKTVAFFKFRQDSESAGIVGSQGRDDFNDDDVEQYFNYMGCLAVEGTYDRMYALQAAKIPAIDIILLFAAAEGDIPKIEEICKAGADVNVKDLDGNTPLTLAGKNNSAKKEETKKTLVKYGAK